MGPQVQSGVAASAIRKVRLDDDHVKALRRVAKKRGVTESDVLRRGIQLQDRVLRRAEAIERLISMIEGPEPKKARWRMKYG